MRSEHLDSQDALINGHPNYTSRSVATTMTPDTTKALAEALEQTHAHAIRDAREFVEAHQANVVAAMDRQRETGSNVLTVAECRMLRDLSATWAEVLGVVTHREYFAAEERVYQKVRQALRKPPAGVRVLEAA